MVTPEKYLPVAVRPVIADGAPLEGSSWQTAHFALNAFYPFVVFRPPSVKRENQM